MEKARINMSRIFRCDAKTLFEAIQEGALFKFTGSDMSKSEMEFKVGGTYKLFWSDWGHGYGAFKEIKPYEKIVFTWEGKTHDGQEANTGSLVTITIKEKAGKSVLTLIHDGIDTSMEAPMNEGWDDALSDLRKSFRELVAKLENNKTGLDLYFKMKKTIRAPRSQVFRYVQDEQHLMKYFGLKTSTPLKEGTDVIWTFTGHSPLTLHVHQVIDNEMIKFQWGNSHVCMTFRDLGQKSTELWIEATGWNADQRGLDDSYSECDGWMEFLCLLKAYAEKQS